MIAIELSERDFEYDIYELVKEFYPGADIHTYIGPEKEKEPADAALRIPVFYGRDSITIQIQHSEPGRECRHDASGQNAAAQGSCKGADHGMEPEETERADRRGSVRANRTADRRGAKDALKSLLYRLLCEETGKTMPWGNLVGIRPTKITMQLLSQGMTPREASAAMQERYGVSTGKADLAAAISERERRILQKIDYRNGYSLYIGIPFCPTICLYCSFSSSPIGMWKDRVDEYLDALCREMESTCHVFDGKRLQTIYIGGGTPTTLEPEQLDRLISKIETCFDLSNVLEFTVEAGRPDSITAEKLKVLKEHGADRISINPQTMNQRTLDLIGRHHTVEQVISSFELARELGFDNINMDLITGLPGEGIDEVRHTMEEIVKLGPDDITVHSLALKRASRLTQMRDIYEKISFRNSDEIMNMTAEYCRSIGNEPYYLYRQKNMAGNFENVGYAAEGKAGLYNILIMEEVQSILALGAGASTKIVYSTGLEPGKPVRIERVENVKDIRSYLCRVDEMAERKRVIAWEKTAPFT